MDPIMVEEWRGLRLRVVEAANPNQIGLEGVLLDEGVRMLSIQLDDGSVRQIPKSGTRLAVVGEKKEKNEMSEKNGMNEKHEMIIDAGEAIMRSEDRTKRLYKKIMGK